MKNVLNKHLLNKNKTYSLLTKERTEETLKDFDKELRKLVSFEDERDFKDKIIVYFAKVYEKTQRIL